MAGKYHPYPSYQHHDALGVETLPAEWGRKKVKHLFRIGRGRVISEQELVEDGFYPVYSSQTSNDGRMGFINTYDFDTDQITWTTDGANAGTVFIRHGKHNCTNVCGTLELNDEVARLKFFLYFLRYATQFHKRPDTNGAKIMNNEMAEITLAIPSLPEQTQIAAFLDHETAKIDALIAKQERLIALLEEKRQAVISHTVTKGLNPDAPLRPSGIDWLGDVPAHWEVKRLKYLGDAWNGLTYSPDDVADEAEGTLVLRSSNIQNASLAFNDNVYVKGNIPAKARVLEGDILICSRNGSRALIGKNVQIPSDLEGAAFGAFMCIFRSNTNDYLSKVLNSSLFEFQSGTFLTSTINQLTTGNLLSFEIPLPPKGERAEIVDFLDRQVPKFNDLIMKSHSAASLLKERRSALISAAVTGKIDVRDWQPPKDISEQDIAEKAFA